MSIGSSMVSFNLICACMSQWNDLISSIRLPGTPSFPKACHSAVRGTESYAFFRSMNTRKDFDLCSQDFSTSCLTVKTMSEHPRLFLNPHWDSGSSSSASFCNLSWIIRAITLPTTSSNAIPLQLSHAYLPSLV